MSFVALDPFRVIYTHNSHSWASTLSARKVRTFLALRFVLWGTGHYAQVLCQLSQLGSYWTGSEKECHTQAASQIFFFPPVLLWCFLSLILDTSTYLLLIAQSSVGLISTKAHDHGGALEACLDKPTNDSCGGGTILNINALFWLHCETLSRPVQRLQD